MDSIPSRVPRRARGGWVVGLLLASATAIVVAPTVLPASYSWVAHTTSEAAAQGWRALG